MFQWIEIEFVKGDGLAKKPSPQPQYFSNEG